MTRKLDILETFQVNVPTTFLEQKGKKMSELRGEKSQNS